MRKVLIFLILLFIPIFCVVAESFVDSQTLYKGDGLTIAGEVYLYFDWKEKVYTGFSSGVPIPPDGYVVDWSGNLENEHSSSIILGTSTQDVTVYGEFPNTTSIPENDLYIWYYSDRYTGNREVKITLSKLESAAYPPGLGWSLSLYSTGNENAEPIVINSENTEIIYSGGPTRKSSVGFALEDFQYWLMRISTDPLTGTVPSNASFSGTITIGVSSI